MSDRQLDGVRRLHYPGDASAEAFKQWHREQGHRLYATDIDLIEWRYDQAGHLHAVAVLELTRLTADEATPEYLAAILDRYEIRGMQAQCACAVAAALNTTAWIVLFREDCSEFWIYNLSKKQGWWHATAPTMGMFLNNLKPGV